MDVLELVGDLIMERDALQKQSSTLDDAIKALQKLSRNHRNHRTSRRSKAARLRMSRAQKLRWKQLKKVA